MTPEAAPTVPTNRPMANPILDVDPATLHVLPGVRSYGADPWKLQVQISKFGRSLDGMPPPDVKRATDGQLVLFNGVTRATRAAKLVPGATIRVELTGTYGRPGAPLPTILDLLP